MESPSKGKPLILAVSAAAILAAGLVAGYLLFAPRPGPPAPDDAPPREQAAPAPAPETRGAPAEPTGSLPGGAPEAASEAAPPPAETGDTARAFLSELRSRAAEGGRAPDLGAVFARAERFATEGLPVDAHLLYFFAAREGHAPSALALGLLYDPTSPSAAVGAMDEPDPGQALKWYRVAAKAGSAEAVERLETLRVWVEAAARGGDAEARRLVMQWQ